MIFASNWKTQKAKLSHLQHNSKLFCFDGARTSATEMHDTPSNCCLEESMKDSSGNRSTLPAIPPKLLECYRKLLMEATSHRPTWKTLLAFAIIYFVWGSTFLAIRVGVREVPPFLLAAIRFLIAGLVLYGWMNARGEPSPTRRQWLSASLLAFLIFVLDYGLLFWAEQRVPSGVAAVMMATIPVFMALSEIIFLRTQRLTARLAVALLVGIGGVAVLMSHSLNLGGAAIDRTGATALIIAAVSWSTASVLTRKLPLPPSKVMSSGAQMLAGGVLLALTAGALGEFRGFHPQAVSVGAWLSLL